MSAALQNAEGFWPEPTAAAACKELGLVSVAAVEEADPRPWLVHSLIPEASVCFIGGAPKVGKSWLSLDLAIAVCTAGDFLGRPVGKAGTVLYFLGEDDRRDVVGRIDALLKCRGLSRSELGERFYLSERVPCLEDENERKLIESAARGATLVVFDPLARFLGKGDENSAKEMRPVTKFLRQTLSRGCGASVVVTHHTTKSGAELRGTGDFKAVAETALTLEGPSPEKGIKVEIVARCGPRPLPMKLRLVKGPDEGMHWNLAKGHGVEDERRLELIRLLRASGSSGLTQQQVQDALHMRREDVKPLLKAVEASRNENDRWCLGESRVPDEGTGPILGVVPGLGNAKNGGA